VSSDILGAGSISRQASDEATTGDDLLVDVGITIASSANGAF